MTCDSQGDNSSDANQHQHQRHRAPTRWGGRGRGGGGEGFPQREEGVAAPVDYDVPWKIHNDSVWC
jgi:hypothetical protein